MVYAVLVVAMVAIVVAMVGLLPDTGCGTLSWTPINIGWAGNFIDVPVVLGVATLTVGVEVAIVGYRIAMWLYHLIRP